MADIKTVIEVGPVIRSQFNNGIEGPQGATGPIGPIGLTGLQGPQGEPGITQDISGKVDKVVGKSLVSDTAITDLTDSGDTTLHTHKSIVNEVSVDNAKVEALSTGAEITTNVNNANTGLVVNKKLGTGKILDLKFNSGSLVNVDYLGQLFAGNFQSINGLRNNLATANSYFNCGVNGPLISRNIADANPALIVNQVNASSTGYIQDWQFGGVSKMSLSYAGTLTTLGIRVNGEIANNSAFNNAYLAPYTDGMRVVRNIADANTCLKINQQHASSTGLITDFQFGGVSKASVDKDGNVSSGAKSAINKDGGIMVKLTNKTGATSVKGNVVRVNSAVDNSFVLAIDTAPDAFGVVYEAVADGAECWVVVSGIADVYFIGSTTRGHLARTFVASEAGYVTGQALSEAVPSSPFATDKHFCEIGHVLSSRTGAGLAKVVLHFN